ncbi:hypothetical protein ACFVUN_27420 [Kitasatospora griseola]|uniref:hypothetical protein n=1 Tax=Kitasatospora griseola TaxID=2064 RepID=UPI0036D81E51
MANRPIRVGDNRAGLIIQRLERCPHRFSELRPLHTIRSLLDILTTTCTWAETRIEVLLTAREAAGGTV